MRYFSITLISVILFFSCTKEDEPINLTAACEKGDRWMTNSVDTFSSIDSLDSFRFVQGGGYHTFVWNRSPLNKVTLSVSQLPDVNATIMYKKEFVRELKCSYKGIEYTYATKLDTMVTLTNKGTHYVLRTRDLKLSTLGSSDIEFRACDLKMVDITP